MTGSNRRPSACKADALPAELILRMYAQRRPTLTGGNPQLPSAQKSLTSVFGMGTGVTSLPSSLDCINLKDKIYYINNTDYFKYFFKNNILFFQNWINRHWKRMFSLLVKSSID